MEQKVDDLAQENKKAHLCQLCGGGHSALDCTSPNTPPPSSIPIQAYVASQASSLLANPNSLQQSLMNVYALGQLNARQLDFHPLTANVNPVIAPMDNSLMLDTQPYDANYVGQGHVQQYDFQGVPQNWRENPNLAWGQNSNQGQSSRPQQGPSYPGNQVPRQQQSGIYQHQNAQQSYYHGNYSQPPPMAPIPQKSSTDILLEQINKTLQEHSRELRDIKTNVNNTTATFQSAIRNLETQVGQLTENANTAPVGGFPSNTVRNPKEVNAIFEVYHNEEEEDAVMKRHETLRVEGLKEKTTEEVVLDENVENKEGCKMDLRGKAIEQLNAEMEHVNDASKGKRISDIRDGASWICHMHSFAPFPG